jgi:hypothetical protein
MRGAAYTDIKRWFATRRCRACRTRYPRRLPNCPTCKTKPGQAHDLPRHADWAAGIGFVTGGPSGGAGGRGS